MSNRRARVESLKQHIFEHLSKNSCVDCGETDIVVLEFDHRDRNTKVRAVANLIHDGASLDKLKSEIAKCDIRCANCHRRRTAKQFGWAKLDWAV